MEKYLATITVYKNNELMFTDKVLTQWISTVASTYVDMDNSPYKVVVEINGNIITLDPAIEQQARAIC